MWLSLLSHTEKVSNTELLRVSGMGMTNSCSIWDKNWQRTRGPFDSVLRRLRGLLRSVAMPAKPLTRHASSAVEDYLERILELINTKGYARVVDIAQSL